MEKYNKKIGFFGEDLAVKYLIKKGYRIIDRNVQIGHKEIDIITNKDNKIVFIEVKTRSNFSFDSPEFSVMGKKIKLLKKAIKTYLIRNNSLQSLFQLDLIVIDIKKNDNMANIKHYMDIF